MIGQRSDVYLFGIEVGLLVLGDWVVDGVSTRLGWRLAGWEMGITKMAMRGEQE